MRTILHSILILLLSSSITFAYEGGKRAVFSPNADFKEIENLIAYEALLNQYETNITYSRGLSTCAEKNQYYLPGHGSADADGCYDVMAYLNALSLSGAEVSYVNNMTATGILEYVGGGDSRTREGEGQFLADHLCDVDYPGSRAMRYGDIKYLYKKNQIPVLADNVYVFEGIRDISASDNKKLVKGEYMQQLGTTSDVTCLDFSSTSSIYKALRLKTDVAGNILDSSQNCSENSRIICVQD